MYIRLTLLDDDATDDVTVEADETELVVMAIGDSLMTSALVVAHGNGLLRGRL